MESFTPNSSNSRDLDHRSEAESPTSNDRWFLIVWTAWGLTIGVLVLWLDRDPLMAAFWVLAGIVTGLFALKVFNSSWTPVFEWYDKFTANPDREHRMFELLLEEKTETEEFDRLIENEANESMLFVPPLFGLFHGTLLGGIGGALSALDPAGHITASQGTVCGMVYGILCFSLLAAVMFAILIPTNQTQPVKSRVAKRALMLISPVFVFPVAWHCITRLIKRRFKNVAPYEH